MASCALRQSRQQNSISPRGTGRFPLGGSPLSTAFTDADEVSASEDRRGMAAGVGNDTKQQAREEHPSRASFKKGFTAVRLTYAASGACFGPTTYRTLVVGQRRSEPPL